MAKKWYVVHTYSGFENKVKKSLEEHVRQHADDGRSAVDVVSPDKPAGTPATQHPTPIRTGKKPGLDEPVKRTRTERHQHGGPA